MAKKKNKGRDPRHKVASLGVMPAHEVLAKGKLFLQQEKYQDAILCFKQLLKQDENLEILKALEQAYLGRIRSLAAKSMTKEAMVLLEIVVARWPHADILPLRLSLLLQVDRFGEAVQLYGQCGTHLASDQRQRLEALFGALLLVGVGGLRPENFPEDSPVARYYPAVLSAMDAVFAGQEELGQEALKQIPFRSPYRDLRTLLTGLLHFQKDKDLGCGILRKIEKDSPYFRAAARSLATTDSPETFLQNLAATPKNEQYQLCAQYGMNPMQFPVIEALAGSDGRPLSLYKIVSRHENCFTKGQRITMLRNILPFCKEQALGFLGRSPDFTSIEKHRILALAAEKDGATSSAAQFWDDYLGNSYWSDTLRHKEIAMVLRHQAKLQKMDDYAYSPVHVLEKLLKSLEYEPSHAETWLEAAEYAKRHYSASRSYAILNDAVAELPENVPILVAAMRACGARNAHKKASSLAKRILEIDPINTSVLDFLVESRLEHGRKLASQKKWLLAEKELQSADTRVKALRYRGRHRICLGMVSLLQGKEEGMAHIAAGKVENGSPLFGHVLTSLEARLYKLPKGRQQEFDRQLRQVEDSAPAIDRGKFLRLINWLLSFDGEQWLMLKEVCQCLTSSFAKAAILLWSRDEGLLICKALEKADLIAALTKTSATLQKKYPEDLEFRVWSLVADTRKGKKRVPMKVFDKLEDLLYQLERKNRLDFVDYIEGVLDKGRSPRVSSFFGEDEEDLDDIFDFGPFKIPKILGSGQKSPPKPKVKPMGGKQLNLFDDEL